MLEFPFFRSLLFPNLIMGVGKPIAFGLLAVTFIVCVNLLQIWFAIITVPILVFTSKAAKEDPFITPIVIQRLNMKEVYD